MKPTERQLREAAAYQFELQADSLDFVIVKRLPNFRYELRDRNDFTQKVYTAMVLAESFDFYEYHLHRGRERVHLLIVQRHNAVLPTPCMELLTGNFHQPGHEPEHLNRTQRTRRNQEEKKLLLSHMVLGTTYAETELAAMELRTRQRYRKLLQEYLVTKRVGRPIAS